ncbi:CpaD family pilus assembly lipoprotein [Parvibaculum sp.]|uniref:CpaD family pilus assembly lipoprotein n=1 Tax=Parvibaculum sp. TaxID=2024848 RepID=UPI0032103366
MTQRRRNSWLNAAAAVSIVLPIISLSFDSVAAEEASCGRWSTQLGANHDNAPTFHGPCANAHNLEKMIDKKSDLTQGRPLGPANAEREAAAVKRYEEGKVKTSTDYKSSSPVSIFGGSSSSSGN